MKISLIKPYPRNAKKHSAKQVSQIANSIQQFGFNQPIVIDKNNIIIVGHGRYEAAKLLKMDDVPTVVVDLTEEKAKAYRLADNKLNESPWDMNLVIEELKNLSIPTIELTGFDKGLLSDEERQAVAKRVLAEMFIIPPMSTLNTKVAYWQHRKQLWIDLGIKSELGGREKLKTSGSFSGSIPGYYDFKNKKEKELGRKISHKEMEEVYLHELIDDSNLKFTETGGILSVFDPVLCEIMYRWFIPAKDMVVLDPFAGGSVRGIVANFLGYRYYGVDLSKEQIEENRRQSKKILMHQIQPQWFVGDSLNIDTQLANVKADMIFSCPPYFDLEIYTKDQKDLSNQTWEDFSKNYRQIIKKSCDLLNDNRFGCFVVSEVREKNGRGGYYRNFVGETIKAFLDAGLKYYNEFILLTAYESAAMRAGRQFNSQRKNTRIHQNVLVFYKGNPKEIKKNFPKLDFSGVEKMMTEEESGIIIK
jgi:DNA modification methylase